MAWTLESLCRELQVPFSGEGALVLSRVCGLEQLLPGGVIFITRKEDLAKIGPGDEIALVVSPEVKSHHHNLIFATDPLALHVKITQFLHPPPSSSQRVHPSAIIGENVILESAVTIDAHVVLYPHVKIGKHTIVRSGVVVMENSTIGEHCLIYPNVSIRENCHIGDRVIIHSGTVIGSDGYGFFQRDGTHHKIPQVGGVIIEDHVEIGACCTIDRSRFYNTIVGKGSKLDNQVHIAHNVSIGEHSLLTAQVGIAGSVTTGSHLVMGGQSGIVDQIQVGKEVTLLSRALVTKNVKDHMTIGGVPGREAKKWRQIQALTNRLDTLFTRIKRLEASLKKKPPADSS